MILEPLGVVKARSRTGDVCQASGGKDRRRPCRQSPRRFIRPFETRDTSSSNRSRPSSATSPAFLPAMRLLGQIPGVLGYGPGPEASLCGHPGGSDWGRGSANPGKRSSRARESGSRPARRPCSLYSPPRPYRRRDLGHESGPARRTGGRGRRVPGHSAEGGAMPSASRPGSCAAGPSRVLTGRRTRVRSGAAWTCLAAPPLSQGVRRALGSGRCSPATGTVYLGAVWGACRDRVSAERPPLIRISGSRRHRFQRPAFHTPPLSVVVSGWSPLPACII